MTTFSTVARRTALAWTCSAFTTFALLGSVGWIFDTADTTSAEVTVAQPAAAAPRA